MIRMPLNVVLGSVRPSKMDGKFYAEFFLLGGNISVLIDRSFAEKLKTASSSGFVAVFEMKPRSVVLFDRSVTVFEPVGLLEIPSGGVASGLPRMDQQGK